MSGMGNMIVEIEDRLMAGQSVKEVAKATKTSRSFVESVRDEYNDYNDNRIEIHNSYDEYVDVYS